MIVTEMRPLNRQKSYYGKAKIIFNGGKTVLQSYNTMVCEIDGNGKFKKLWDGYSATTQKHIINFCKMYGVPCGGKSWWESLPVEK